MNHLWDGPLTEFEKHFLESRQMSRRLATVIEESGTESMMPEEEPNPLNPFDIARSSTTAPIHPHSSNVSATSANQRMSISGPQMTRPAEPIAQLPLPGSESLYGFSWSNSRPTINYPLLPGNPQPLDRPLPDSTVQYPVLGNPAPIISSRPQPMYSSTLPTVGANLDSRPRTQTRAIGQERDSCLTCAKKNVDCIPRQSRSGEGCVRCRQENIACKPIPAEYLPGFLVVQQLFREGRKTDGYAAHWNWTESMEKVDRLGRIERQLFLLNRNMERLLSVYLRMNGETAPPPFIENQFPEA